METTRDLEMFENINVANTETVKNDDLQSDVARDKSSARARSYLVVFINRSNLTFIKYRLQFVGAATWSSWSNINVSRTCSLGTLQDCFNQQKWQDLFVIDCDSRGFILEVESTPNAQGESLRLSTDPIYPDCNRAGGVVSYE